MKKIVLIEDNLEMRENTAEILELADFNVHVAANGKEGVKLVKEQLPDLVICDIMMPELDGYGVLHILSRNEETAGIPFIFLTAKAESSDFRKGMNLGADDYLTKPFEETELLDAIEGRFKRKLKFNKDYKKEGGLEEFVNDAKSLIELKDKVEDKKTRVFKKKDKIYYEGDHPHGLLFIDQGKVKTSKINQDGKELVTGVHSAGDFIGFMPILEDRSHEETATALENTQVTFIPNNVFLTMLHGNKDVSQKLIELLSSNIRENQNKLLKLAYGTVRERVAEVLLQLHEKLDPSGDGEINVSRDDLAAMVGTATESLIRMLSEFKEDSLIVSKGKKIKVVNEAGLKRRAQNLI